MLLIVPELKDYSSKTYSKIENSIYDEKDRLIDDEQKRVGNVREQDMGRGAVAELNSLNDFVLIASDLYDLLNNNFSVWNSLINNKRYYI